MREHQLYYCNPDWMITGGQVPWNAIARNVQDLQAHGKTPYDRRFWNHSKDQLFDLVHWWNMSQKLRERQSENSSYQFGKKASPGIFVGFALITW